MTIIEHHVSIFWGMVGGFLAALVLSPWLTGLTRGDCAPTDVFWAKYVGDRPPEEYANQGTALHFACGALAGGVLAVLEPIMPVEWAVRETVRAGLVTGVANGLVYGVVLVVVALGGLRLTLDRTVDWKRFGLLCRFNLAYGMLLGAMFGYYLSVG